LGYLFLQYKSKTWATLPTDFYNATVTVRWTAPADHDDHVRDQLGRESVRLCRSLTRRRTAARSNTLARG